MGTQKPEHLREAIHHLEEALRCLATADDQDAPGRNTTVARLYDSLGVAFVQLHEYDPAIACFRRAIEADSSRARYHCNLSHALESGGDIDAAIEEARQATTLDPHEPHAQNNLGCLLANHRSQFDEAIQCFHRASHLDPARVWYHSNEAIACMRAGLYVRAIRACSEAVAIDHTHANAWTTLGNVLLAYGRCKEAAVAYQQGSLLSGNAFREFINYGEAAFRTGLLREAITQYLGAIEKNQNPLVAHLKLAEVHLELREIDEAVGACDSALKLLADNPRATGDVRDSEGNERASGHAVAELPEALDIVSLLSDVSDRLHRAGALDIARAAAQMAARLDTEAYRGRVATRRYRAFCTSNRVAEYSTRGVFAVAEREFKRATTLFSMLPERDPQEWIPWLNLASLYHNLGRLDDARRAFEHTLALRQLPDPGRVYLAFAQLLQDLACFREALDVIRSSCESEPLLAKERLPIPATTGSAEHLRIAERLVALEDRVNAVLRGGEQLESAEDLALLAVILRARGEHAAAARFFAKAFARDPSLKIRSKRLGQEYRFDAARAAVLAGAGRGNSGTALTLTERAQFRHEALRWLEEELTYLVEDFIPPRDAVRASQPNRWAVLAELRRWQVHVDFADVRDVDGLGRLPAAERDAWIAFWHRIEAAVEMLDEKQQRPALPLFSPL
ncbi:MAG: tetratricopeptide repeat protein [Polyangiaceae bacterium]|nr:tetratricopeptide repeat protein [Polyangiaceae bacterium]